MVHGWAHSCVVAVVHAPAVCLSLKLMSHILPFQHHAVARLVELSSSATTIIEVLPCSLQFVVQNPAWKGPVSVRAKVTEPIHLLSSVFCIRTALRLA